MVRPSTTSPLAAWFRRLAAKPTVGAMFALAFTLSGAAILQPQFGAADEQGVLTRLSLEPLHRTITKSAGSEPLSSQDPQAVLDFGLFYEHATLQLVLTDPPTANWQVSFDSLPGMFAVPPSGYFAAPGVQYCNVYLDRTALPFKTYNGSIIVQWSIPATDVVPTRFQVADTLVNGGFAPPNANPLTPGMVLLFRHQDTLSLWSASFGKLYFELRADGITEAGTDQTANVPGRGIYMWWPDQTATVPQTASFLTSVSRMTIGSASDGDDSARITYTIQGTHYPPQCIQPPDLVTRCGELVQNQFKPADSGSVPIWWHQVAGPGTTDSSSGRWQWNPDCTQVGVYMIAAVLGDPYFLSADTCDFQVTILDSSGFRFNQGDADCNDILDILDIVGVIDYVFGGTSICYGLLADWDCNGAPDVLDLVAQIDYTFSGGPGPNATTLISAPASVLVGDTAVFIASTCLPGREGEIQWFSGDGSPTTGSGPVFKTTFTSPGEHTTTFECCQGTPDTASTICW